MSQLVRKLIAKMTHDQAEGVSEGDPTGRLTNIGGTAILTTMNGVPLTKIK